MDGVPRGPVGAAGTAPDLNRSAVSRYIQLATLFRRRVGQGVWRTGQQIPTVDELAAECGVARGRASPGLGQHTADVLGELGLAVAGIAAPAARGVV